MTPIKYFTLVQWFSIWSMRPLSNPGEAFITIIIILRHYLFHCVNTCIDGAKEMVGRTAVTFTQIKAVAPNRTSSPCILHHPALVGKKKKLVSLKNVLDEAVKIISIKSWPLSINLFNIRCDKTENIHETFKMHHELLNFNVTKFWKVHQCGSRFYLAIDV